MEWIYLIMAIPSEVVATLALRAAATGRTSWYAVVAVGYLAAFVLLSLALDEGMALGVAYGIWAAAGVALTAIGSRLVFKEPLSLFMGAGIVLIISGILLIEVGGAH